MIESNNDSQHSVSQTLTNITSLEYADVQFLSSLTFLEIGDSDQLTEVYLGENMSLLTTLNVTFCDHLTDLRLSSA